MSRLIASVFLIVAFAAMGSYSPDAESAPPDRCSPWPECKDGGEDPPPPPPAACVDVFPDFVYKSTSGEIWLSSTCGYRTEKIADQGIAPQLHLYTDAESGLARGAVFWLGSDSADNDTLHRAGFEIAANGSLIPLGEQQVLPASGETGSDQELFYFTNPNIWGDPASSNAYWTTQRYILKTDGTEIADWMLVTHFVADPLGRGFSGFFYS